MPSQPTGTSTADVVATSRVAAENKADVGQPPGVQDRDVTEQSQQTGPRQHERCAVPQPEIVRDYGWQQAPLHGRLNVAAERLLALQEIGVAAIPLERAGDVVAHQPESRSEENEAEQQAADSDRDNPRGTADIDVHGLD